MVKVGETVTTLPLYSKEYETEETGVKWSLAQHKGEVLALFFFPKAGTPVCTAEGCKFRDEYSALKKLGAEVVGVSKDSPATNKAFKAKNKMQFTLVSDTDGSLRSAFGVGSFFGLLPGRKTVVIDKEGRVASEFNSLLKGEDHIAHVLESVEKLRAA